MLRKLKLKKVEAELILQSVYLLNWYAMNKAKFSL